MDYELRAAKARQAVIREQTGYTPPTEPLPVYKPQIDYLYLGQLVDVVIGDCIPDSDPIDRLGAYVRSFGIDSWDITKHLNKGCRKVGYKSYNEALVQAWDGWNEICEPDQRRDNPWK